jgi:HEAT repeat protein
MKRLLLPIVAALAAGFLFTGCSKSGSAPEAGPPAEPAYQGKPASQWVEQLAKGESADRAEAAKALEAMGAEAGTEAIPALAKALKDAQVRVEASGALTRMGDSAVPALIEALGDRSMGARRRASWALSQMGAAAVPALVKALEDRNVRIRQEAAVALGMIGPEAKDAVDALAGRLKDEDRWVRQYAAEAIGAIGHATETAAEALRDLRAEDARCRFAAEQALKQIGGAYCAKPSETTKSPAGSNRPGSSFSDLPRIKPVR